MEAVTIPSDMAKPSFAKVAASVSKGANNKHAKSPTRTRASTTVIADGSSNAEGKRAALETRSGDLDAVTTSLNDIRLDSSVPSLVVDGRGYAAEGTRPIIGKESGSDDSQRCDSSSELDTKPPSLDGKSITSGTTFALDEKESLRPDDSASVQAAADDDDSLSIRGSLVAGSRMSSMAERRGIHLAAGASGPGILTPQSTSSERGQPLNPPVHLSAEGSSDALNVIYRQAPDDKLLDALASPRDRYFLLRLEKDVIDFVQDSKEPYMDLPPSNSFCRMLTHKLADYYHMTHSYEPHIGSVRIFRTPFCRVPPSLATMAPQANPSTSSTPPPAVLPRKIMRRGQDGDGLTSAGASKPTSESGSEAKDKPLSNQKLSREEREEMYKLARERIFGSSEDSIPENEGENDMSRTSSVSASNRAANNKRGKTGRQRRDDSDSFDSRNQYTAYWGPQQQTWVSQSQGQYVPPGPGQFGAQPQPQYSVPMAPTGYTQQAGGYANMPVVPPGPSYPTYGMQQYPPQPPPQRYQPSGSPMNAYGTPVAANAAPQGWTQAGYPQQSYPSPRVRATTPGNGPAQVGIPYAYGQLPVNANPNDPKSQHPIPGSYNRNHAFNPKTQSFVPGGEGMPIVQPPQPPFTAPGSHHGSPQIGTPPHLAYGPYPPAVQQPYGGGYMMARQGSSNSMPGYHAAHHLPPPPHHAQQAQMSPMVGMPQPPPPQHLPQVPPGHIPGRPTGPQGSHQAFTHLPTYGNPATLPQKPATGI